MPVSAKALPTTSATLTKTPTPTATFTLTPTFTPTIEPTPTTVLDVMQKTMLSSINEIWQYETWMGNGGWLLVTVAYQRNGETLIQTVTLNGTFYVNPRLDRYKDSNDTTTPYFNSSSFKSALATKLTYARATWPEQYFFEPNTINESWVNEHVTEIIDRPTLAVNIPALGSQRVYVYLVTTDREYALSKYDGQLKNEKGEKFEVFIIDGEHFYTLSIYSRSDIYPAIWYFMDPNVEVEKNKDLWYLYKFSDQETFGLLERPSTFGSYAWEKMYLLPVGVEVSFIGNLVMYSK